jgi:hypothetical protein
VNGYTAGNGLTALPRNVCQICGQKHDPQQPHHAESLYYKKSFQKAHGRLPTWADAIEHCPDDVKALSRLMLGYLHVKI